MSRGRHEICYISLPMHMTKTLAAAALVLATLTHRAEAWGSKEHIVLTNLATLKLLDDPATPPAMNC